MKEAKVISLDPRRSEEDTSENQFTHEELLKVISFNRDTGEFWWLERGPGRPKQKPAGGLDSDGYRRIRIGKFRYHASRLAWFYCYGRWPVNMIDHIDRVRDNDKLSNLREATAKQNAANKVHSERLLQHNNTSGKAGVYWDSARGLWCARIYAEKKSVHLGRFETREEAVAARKEAEVKISYDKPNLTLKAMQ